MVVTNAFSRSVSVYAVDAADGSLTEMQGSPIKLFMEPFGVILMPMTLPE
jgi:hypothetical protein